MTLDRRDFLKLAATGSATLLAAPAAASDGHAPARAADAFGVLVDTTFCIGCRKCELGCNEVNSQLARRGRTEFEDKSVFTQHRRPDAETFTVVNRLAAPNPLGGEAPLYLKVQCLHCEHPACASACIVGALRKDPRGPVTYDAWKCIGCRYCMVACPFQVPAYEYADAASPEVRKCSFCAERILSEGRRPGCVENCPNEALTFGRRDELVALAHQKIARSPERYVNHVYGEHEAGGTSWLYLSAIDFRQTELPALDDRPLPALTEKIQHGVFKAFVPPLALYGLLGLVMWSRRRSDEDAGDGGGPAREE